MSTQRKTGTAIAAVASLSLVLAACDSSSGGASGATGNPVTGGTLTYAINTDADCLDPHQSPADVAGFFARPIVDSLVSLDAAGKIYPWLATSWTTSPDGKAYTFSLRTDVTFSDGEPFDAAAVKANFDHIAAKTTKSQYAASLFGPYAGTDVVDPYTVKVRFTQPFAPFLQAASTAYLGIYSPKALADNADKLCAGGPVAVGSGPFTFTGYTKGQSVVLTRNPGYAWAPPTAQHTGPAHLQTVTFRILPENSTRLGALTSGQVDVAKPLPPANAKTVGDTPNLSIERPVSPGSVYSLYLNTRSAPLDDQRVRTAIQRGIDVGADVKAIYFGQLDRAWSPLSPVTPAYDKTLENSWPYDPAKSAQLLDEAGWTGRDAGGYRTKDGRRLTLSWPSLPAGDAKESRDVLAQAIQADLKKIGVEAQHPPLDVGTYSAKANAGDFHLLDLSWARFEPDVLRSFFNSASGPPKGQNASFLKDPEVDTWTNAGAATADERLRAVDYAGVQHKVIDIAAVVPLYVPNRIVGVSKRVKGLSFDPNAWSLLYDVWRDGQ
jgi:peptide/nickel transport system substrate-binding protein